MIDFTDNSVVDSHCHAFLPIKENDSFEQYLTLADHKVPKIDMENTFFYQYLVNELSRLMEYKGTNEQIIEERNRRYRKDPREFIKVLFEDAKIETLLVDTGYPSEEFSGYSVNFSEFSKVVPSNLKEIFRIDNSVYKILKNGLDFDSGIEKFYQDIKDAINRDSVGLKTVIAYRTGLEIKRTSDIDFKKSYERLIMKKISGKSAKEILGEYSKDVKTVLDSFVLESVEKSVEYKVPYQIHVGMGDAPIIDLRLANPILLHDLINDEKAKDAKIVLTHGGYPWIEEAGFLVNTYPNVYLDLSETIPFITIGIKEKLLNLLEMAPINKIMYGSDGYNIPELHWISAILAKRALSNVCKELLKYGIKETWVEKLGKNILSENSKTIYKL
jgi:hypothetical protein